MKTDNLIIREYMRDIGRRGGRKSTPAQTEARRRSLAKARKSRWKKKD